MSRGYVYKHKLYNVLYNDDHEEFFLGKKGVLGEDGIHIDWKYIIEYLKKNGYEIKKLK